MSGIEDESVQVEEPAVRREDRAERRKRPLVMAEQRDWERLSRAIERQIGACVELDAEPEAIARLADQASALADEMEARAGGKRHVLTDIASTRDEVMHYLPFSPLMGRLNPASPKLVIRPDGDARVVCEVRLNEIFEGGTGLVHGGMIAAIYDELLAAANLRAEVGGPTGGLSVRYRRPTPLYEALRFEAWVEGVSGRKVTTHGRCLVDGEVVTEAEGLFVLLAEAVRGTDWHRHENSE